jgi:WD40 repeat protein
VKAASEYGPVLNMPKETYRKQPDVTQKEPDTPENASNDEQSQSSESTSQSYRLEEIDDFENESRKLVNLKKYSSYLKKNKFLLLNSERNTRPSHTPIRESIFDPNNANKPGGSKEVSLFNSQQYALTHKKNFITMPKPEWHPPWKLCRVISGHQGWVRCMDVDPSNEWFVTGATDRIIKVIFPLQKNLVISFLEIKVFFLI